MFYVYFMPCIVLGAMYLSSVVLRGKCCVMTWLVWCIVGHDAGGGGYIRGSQGGLALLVFWSHLRAGVVCVCVGAEARALLRDAWWRTPRGKKGEWCVSVL